MEERRCTRGQPYGTRLAGITPGRTHHCMQVLAPGGIQASVTPVLACPASQVVKRETGPRWCARRQSAAKWSRGTSTAPTGVPRPQRHRQSDNGVVAYGFFLLIPPRHDHERLTSSQHRNKHRGCRADTLSCSRGRQRTYVSRVSGGGSDWALLRSFKRQLATLGPIQRRWHWAAVR